MSGHVHSCPECYEHVPCDSPGCDYTEPDLTLDNGTLCGPAVVCDKCETSRAPVSDPLPADLVETVLRLDREAKALYCPAGLSWTRERSEALDRILERMRDAAPALARAIQAGEALRLSEYRAGYEAGLRGDLRGHEGEWRRGGAEHGYAVYCQRGAEKRAQAGEVEREGLRAEVRRLREAIQRGRGALRGDRSGAYGRLAEADAVLAAVIGEKGP